MCTVCGDAACHCEPVCQSCLSGRELQTQLQERMTQLTVRLIDWAEKYDCAWADGSDAEVALEEILDEARDLLPPGARDEAFLGDEH